MPSIDDVYNQLQQATNELQGIQNELTQVNLSLTQLNNRVNTGFTDIVSTLNVGFTDLMKGLQSIAALQYFGNQVLLHHSQQNDTIICILENVSRNTCNLFTEAHRQTGLQTDISGATGGALELLKSAYPTAALERERLEKLRQQLEACCPPASVPPACAYQPCETHPFDGESPRPDVPAFQAVAQG
jgi:hypothetical protein